MQQKQQKRVWTDGSRTCSSILYYLCVSSEFSTIQNVDDVQNYSDTRRVTGYGDHIISISIRALHSSGLIGLSLRKVELISNCEFERYSTTWF